ncbi:mannosyltransferase [Knufia obscura]|uniref:Mannosyltransferase n=1 Tax=Knufia obscura TaxID=1635080 RepID=A0ABR0R975_9EURO|nr:mannosyltransferase [Knufia obscura]
MRFLSPNQTHLTSPDAIRASLTDLLSSYFTTMDRLGIKETWIAHGTLLGHYWGGHILPWDTGIDVQMSASNMARLVSSRYNHTVHPMRLLPRRTIFNQTVRARSRPSYLLDINPYWTTPKTSVNASITWDVANKIDARWIGMSNGKFIDITIVHEGRSGKVLLCKDGHVYLPSTIYPLHESTLDGIQVRIPANPEKVLSDEYGMPALTNKNRHW